MKPSFRLRCSRAILVDNEVASVGCPLAGKVSITLDEPTTIEDISVNSNGISYTARIVDKGYRIMEYNTHADITTSLFDQPRGTALSPGEHVLLFTIQVPFRTSKWVCPHSAMDVGLVRTGLPPTCHANRKMYVDYSLEVTKPFLEQSIILSENVALAAKCDGPPEEQLSGLKKPFSLSSTQKHVNLSIVAEMALYNDSEACLGKNLSRELYISVQDEDISRTGWLLDIQLTVIKVALRSKTSGYSQKRPTRTAENTRVLLENNKLDIPLAPEQSQDRAARFRIDYEVFKSISFVPDFDIISLPHSHKIVASIGLSVNYDGSATFQNLAFHYHQVCTKV
ncbi:hypothetical protein POJ06DRAFT_282084 [Lipomyces tetrasporus]|uniref:Arrestin-like N-terminal domain-containing protein n=1 Tax=Lipomyces tetrasporus TaxID=54092 RepID=A0AAD7VS86_9ASCO|nr:uncharacterized protein POJ06DRAFT_282084 [Lipomyces tetrasporus]KAJ8100073.1 hypothetical protein POJ06DRAFT_282084 [Lipomyces tetrasporus]